MEQVLSWTHIAIGSAVVLLGLGALLLRKGSGPHRLSGNLFVIAMAGLVLSGGALSAMRPDVPGSNVLGLLTLYLASTGWRTARRKDGKAGKFEALAALLALSIVGLSLITGWNGAHHPIGIKDQMFAPVAYVIAGVTALFIALDVSVIARGGLSGRQRTARHISRMGFAAFFASAAGLIGQSLRFPEPVRPLLYVIVLLMLALTLFWLVKTLWFGKRRIAAA